ncbi:ABC transporter permease [Puteibacter caeruleilacunae]|nr:ABC transporter permease [Puteibacter caeruleilacunae]
MFDLDRWTEIFSALKKNKLRSFLTAFGVFWGIFMLMILAGAGNGLQNGVQHGMKSFATNSCFVWTDPTSKPYKGFKRGRRWEFDNTDNEYLRQKVDKIEYMAPRLFGWNLRTGDNTIRGKHTGSFTIMGDYPVYNNIDPHDLLKGRFINEIDIKEKRKVCVIGTRVEELMFEKDENPIGQYLKVMGIYYQVVGVHDPENPNVNFGGRKEETIYLPFTTMQQAYNYGNEVHFYAITAKKGNNVAEMEKEIITLLKKRHSIHPDDSQAVAHVNVEKQVKQMDMLFMGINILVWIVGVGTLLAGVIGVSNIMLVIVKERTQEIGIQRALGATPGRIIGQIMLESVFLTTLAGYIGLSLGVFLLAGVNSLLDSIRASGNGDNLFIRDVEVDLTLALISLTVLIIAGLFAGLIPARRAIQIKPIDALRDE